MRIALDAVAGDFGAKPNIEGALRAVRDFDCEVILVGQQSEIETELAKQNGKTGRITVVPGAPPVPMGLEPTKACKENPDSSIMVCAKLAAEGKADAMISAGNTGATMVASFLNMGRIKGISRPAIATPMPTAKGVSLLLDAGANSENKPRHLAEFAIMAAVYFETAFGKKNPSVGILSVGEEETKGSPLVKETISALKQIGINFYGPVEGRDIPFGLTDIVVTDGFTGNVVLKLAEGLSKAMFSIIKEEIKANPLYKIGAFLSMGAFKSVKDRMNPETYGGAPLLGINGISLICHGKSSGQAIYNAIKNANDLHRTQVLSKMAQDAAKFTGKLDEIFKGD